MTEGKSCLSNPEIQTALESEAVQNFLADVQEEAARIYHGKGSIRRDQRTTDGTIRIHAYIIEHRICTPPTRTLSELASKGHCTTQNISRLEQGLYKEILAIAGNGNASDPNIPTL